jgi:hypothetical protein
MLDCSQATLSKTLSIAKRADLMQLWALCPTIPRAPLVTAAKGKTTKKQRGDTLRSILPSYALDAWKQVYGEECGNDGDGNGDGGGSDAAKPMRPAKLAKELDVTVKELVDAGVVGEEPHSTWLDYAYLLGARDAARYLARQGSMPVGFPFEDSEADDPDGEEDAG